MTNPILGGGGPAHRRMSSDSDRELEGSNRCWGLCCGPGLALGIVACIYFIIILPAGLFLAMVGGPKSTVLLLVGLSFVFIPLVIFSVACFCYRRRKRRQNAGYHTPSANFVHTPSHV
ncbi:uncharacterized protein LOC110982144 [Acanthaster planci]|uniref:Uncharacterized protein LOC110982144 n=1 Tax=Acanthaster planci TaxID=133434 RepID=A0A8B7YXQ5_ACAPL|nr:uncharacterized protein LOC110982144 [Acanthaster planci]